MATKRFFCPVLGKPVQLYLQVHEVSAIGSPGAWLSVDCDCSAEGACPARHQPDCRCRQLNEEGMPRT